MEELGRNRETLNRVRSNVGVVSSTMDEARRIIRSMTKREMRTRICVAFFALLLLGMIVGLIVYFTQRNKDGQ